MAGHNLPPQPTAFVGRSSELAEIGLRLDDAACRLLTLLGPGGIGKTRMALAVGERMADHFTDGVCFVPLQAITTPENMVSLMANALDFQFYEGADAKQQLLDFLHNKHMLILMDNFEHVLGGAGLVVEILNAAPQVRILVTSREVLNLREEWLYHVEGMSYPAHGDSDIEDYHAVQLFVERARQVRTDFSVDVEHAGVIRIVRLVEGMPLAIELAATWLTTLSCAAIADEIEHNMEILTTSLRDVPARHRSVHVVFEQSWQMLSSQEQTVFMKMAVFRGGCTRVAAEAVTGASLSVLSALVNKSFIRRTASDRYEIHELMRQNGAAYLEASGQAVSSRDAHSAYYLHALAQREADIKGGRQLAALDEIESDLENVRAAWEWAVQRQDEDGINQAMQCLFWFCVSRYRPQDGMALFQHALEVAFPEDTVMRLRVHLIYLKVVAFADDPSDRGELEEIRRIAEEDELPSILAFCLATMGEAAVSAGHFGTALPHYERALTLYRQLDDRFHMARMLRRVGYCHTPNGQFELAAVRLRQGLELSRSIGDRIGTANCVYNLGSVLGFANDFEGFESAYREALTIRREVGDRAGTAMNLGGLALPALFRGDIAAASALADEAFDIASHINHQDSKCMALGMQGLIAAVREDYPRSKKLLEAARSLAVDGVKASWSELGLAMVGCGQGDYASAKLHLQRMLEGQPALGSNYAAPFLLVLALIYIDEGDAVGGIEIISLIHHHPEISRVSELSDVWPLVARIQAQLKIDLGQDIYDAARERGKTLDYDTIVADLFEQFSAPQHASEDTISDPNQAANQALLVPLTRREHEILLLIAQGLSNRQIAERLVIEVSTVKRHVNNCYGKLDVTSRTQAIIKAQQLNLV